MPRGVVYLCEYLLRRIEHLRALEATNPPTHSSLVVSDILSMINEPLDDDMFQAVRARFNQGEFYDCKAPVCMFRLVKVRSSRFQDTLP